MGDPQFVRQRPGAVPGKIGSRHVSQGPENKGQVFRGPNGAVRVKAGFTFSVGQPLFIGIADIGRGPVGDILEGGGPCARQGILLLAQQTDQHGYALGTGGGAVQGKDGESLRVGVCSLKKAHVVELPGGRLLLLRGCGSIVSLGSPLCFLRRMGQRWGIRRSPSVPAEFSGPGESGSRPPRPRPWTASGYRRDCRT